MGPDGEWERPKPPARQFPADTGPAGVIPDHARVDLIFERSRLLSGSVGGQPVRLDLNVPTHNGTAAGTIAGIPASATWKNGDNYYNEPTSQRLARSPNARSWPKSGVTSSPTAQQQATVERGRHAIRVWP